MQVRSRAAAGAAAQADRVTRHHQVVLHDQALRKVAVVGLQSVGMPDHHQVAIAARCLAAAHIAHHPVEGAAQRVADTQRNIDTIVRTAPAVLEGRTPASHIRCHEMMRGIDQQQIHFFRQVGDLHVAVCMDRLDVPVVEKAGGVDIGALQFDVIPGVVVEQDDLHVFVRCGNSVDGLGQHQRRIGLIVDFIHFRMREIGCVGLLCMQGECSLQQDEKDEDDMFGHRISIIFRQK